jgi:HMGL-like
VIIEVPIGYPKLVYQFKWTWEDVLRKSVPVIQYAKSRGLHVVYFPYDTTRAREEDLKNLLTRIVADAPPDSIGVVDTMGCALPEAIKHMVRLVKSWTKLPVEVHTHNDFRHGGGDGTGGCGGGCGSGTQLRERTGRAHGQCGARGADGHAARALRL